MHKTQQFLLYGVLCVLLFGVCHRSAYCLFVFIGSYSHSASTQSLFHCIRHTRDLLLCYFAFGFLIKWWNTQCGKVECIVRSFFFTSNFCSSSNLSRVLIFPSENDIHDFHTISIHSTGIIIIPYIYRLYESSTRFLLCLVLGLSTSLGRTYNTLLL